MVDDATLPIIICEGEKKALSLWRLATEESDPPAFVPIAVSGVWGWKGKTGIEAGPKGDRETVKGPIPDLGRVQWRGRTVSILFDSDRKSNPLIRSAERGLALELKSRGAPVIRIVELPELSGLEKTGADDFLAHVEGGPQRMLGLIKTARLFKPESASVAELIELAEVSTLTSASTIDQVHVVLRALAGYVTGSDALTRAAVREAAVKHLTAIGINSPARLVDAALLLVAVAEGPATEESDTFADPVPWPERVNIAELLDKIVRTLLAYLVLPKWGYEAAALWIIHTYLHAVTWISPLLVIVSPTKRCGKTLLLEFLDALVLRPLSASNISAAAVYRSIERWRPALLVDEGDTFLPRNDDLRGVINSGHRRSNAFVMRCEGDPPEARRFSSWGPKAIACIGKLADTLEDRAIILRMRRRAPGEKIKRMRSDKLHAELEPLRRQAVRWAADHLKDFSNIDPQMPEELNDRAMDNWRPLVAVADLAGENWPDKARAAAKALSGVVDVEDQEIGVLLLSDLRGIFDAEAADKIETKTLLEKLVALDERPWRDYNKKPVRPITDRQLAKILRPFGVKPGQFWARSSALDSYMAHSSSSSFHGAAKTVHPFGQDFATIQFVLGRPPPFGMCPLDECSHFPYGFFQVAL
jgi:putative DNA primase/helicase